VLSSTIEIALEGERVQHKAKMDEVLARTIESELAHKAQMDEVLAKTIKSERAHKIQMDEMMAAQSEIMSRFSQMESM
jgi:hypothetical protein